MDEWKDKDKEVEEKSTLVRVLDHSDRAPGQYQQSPGRDLYFILMNVSPHWAVKAPAASCALRRASRTRYLGVFIRRYPRPAGLISGAFPTSTGGQSAAPLAVAPTLGSRGTLQQVASVTGEVHHVIQVELTAVGESMRGVSRVATCDGCVGRQPSSVSENTQAIALPCSSSSTDIQACCKSYACLEGKTTRKNCKVTPWFIL